jgi:hypothetical protein
MQILQRSVSVVLEMQRGVVCWQRMLFAHPVLASPVNSAQLQRTDQNGHYGSILVSKTLPANLGDTAGETLLFVSAFGVATHRPGSTSAAIWS